MKYLILVLLILSNFKSIIAKCGARWQQSSLQVTLETSKDPKQFNLMINNSSNRCTGLQIISDSNVTNRTLKLDTESLSMDIYTDPSAESVLPLRSITSQSFVLTSLKKGNLVSLFTRIDTVFKSGHQKAGIYTYKESLSLFDKDMNFLDRIDITFNLEIPLEMNIQLVRPGTQSSIGESLTFNRIEQGEEVEVDTLINSNIGYSLWIESENAGSLKHETLDQEIKYLIFKNNQNVGNIPSQGYQIFQNQQQTNELGERVNLRFRIDQETDDKPAGEYLDVIRLNIQSEM